MQSKTNILSFKGTSHFLVFVSVFFLLFSSLSLSASHSEGAAEEKFKPGDMIMHHISDAHQIHIVGSIYVPLPIILYNHGHLEVFSSSRFWNGFDAHGELQFKPYTSASGVTYENHHEKIVVSGAHGHDATATATDSLHTGFTQEPAIAEHPADEMEHASHEAPLDFSITKQIFGMLFVLTLMVILFIRVAASYKKRQGQAPRGMQNFFEVFILFIRNEVAIPSIGKKKADKFVPFLLTAFFFIWMSNMLGLIPFVGGFNITGTMSITLVLATLVFLITSFNGNGHYWGHIFWPPGIPLGIKLILVPIEIMSLFIKPAVLMIRLTANITAGHIIILAFVGLVLLFGQGNPAAGFGVGIGATLFMVFMFFIELLVAFLQAYVFTLLAALYFGDATQEHHHAEESH